MWNSKCDKQMVDLIIIHYADEYEEKKEAQMCSDRNRGGCRIQKALKKTTTISSQGNWPFFLSNLGTAPRVYADPDTWVAVGIAELVYVT